jgi:hypothetical protein
MDPVAAAVVAALAAGAATSAGQVGEQVLVDAYTGLKALLRRKFGEQSGVAKAVQELEAKPDSTGRKETLKEEVADAKAAEDPEVRAVAEALLEQVKQRPGGGQLVQQATGSYIAQATGGSTASVNIGQANPPKP